MTETTLTAVTNTGFVMFSLGERTFATTLDEVREIVRLGGLERLPGVTPPLAGTIVLRGNPLPVLDVRAPGSPDDQGDVLVMTIDGDTVGVAVDGVVAVLHPDELPRSQQAPSVLPSYVLEVRRHRDEPVMLVDVTRLLSQLAGGVAAAQT